MDYFKINYNKLQNLSQIKFFKLVLIIIILLLILLLISSKLKIYQKFECYGVYSNNLLTIKINNELSDKLRNSEFITFNNCRTNFEIKNYGKYEIINNNIYQEIEIIMDKNFYDNEVGLVKFYYDKKSIFKFILDLFN